MKTSQIATILTLGARFNDVDALMYEVVLPKMAKRFRAKTPFLNTIHLDTQAPENESKVKEVGDEIDIQMPIDLGEADELPMDGESTPTSWKAQKVKMKLDQHLYKEATMSDRQFSTHMSANTVPSILEGLVDAVAKGINKRAVVLTKDIYNVIGNANGNARNTSDVIDLADFLDGVAPEEGRYLALNRKTNGDLLKAMSDNSKFGNESVHAGQIGNYQGFNVFKDIGLPSQVSGGAASTYTVSAPLIKGAKTLSAVGGTGNFNYGDSFSVAGVEGEYVIKADQVGAGTIQFEPELKGPAEAGAVITVLGDHPLDIGYHHSTFAVVFRELDTPEDDDSGIKIYPFTDPLTGITMRFVRWRAGSSTKTHWKFEVLAGFKTIRPEWACRMLAG